MSLSRDPEKWKETRRKGVRNYRERVKREVLDGERDWNSLDGAVNRERREERHERDFGDKADFIRRQHCDACGRRPPSDPDHHPTRGAGGTSDNLWPLCTSCHEERHRVGIETFQEWSNTDATERTSYWHQRWLEHVAETGEE